MLGLLYYNGIGVAKNLDTAAVWLQKAADQKIGVSWQVLGRIASDAKKPKDAESGFRNASELGVVGAMLDLAQNLMDQGAAAASKEAALPMYSEAYRWIQTALAAVPSGPQRDQVHAIRITIEDEVNKRAAGGAEKFLAAAKSEGTAKAKELRASAEAQAAEIAAKAKTSNAPSAGAVKP